jgi:hypothetical protein
MRGANKVLLPITTEPSETQGNAQYSPTDLNTQNNIDQADVGPPPAMQRGPCWALCGYGTIVCGFHHEQFILYWKAAEQSAL